MLQMINDEDIDTQIRKFMKDFLGNDQGFDNFSLLEMDYVKDQSAFEQIVFLLPSDQFVWHMDYDQVEQHKIYLIPMSASDYTQKVENTIQKFFK